MKKFTLIIFICLLVCNINCFQEQKHKGKYKIELNNDNSANSKNKPKRSNVLDIVTHISDIQDIIKSYLGIKFSLALNSSPVHSLAFSQDEKLLALSEIEGQSIKIFDTNNFKLIQTLQTRKNFVLSLLSRNFNHFCNNIINNDPWGKRRDYYSYLEFSKNEKKQLASVFTDESLNIWDLDSGKALHSFDLKEGSKIKYAPNGKYFVYVHRWSNNLKILDANNNYKLIRNLELEKSLLCESDLLDFSQDSNQIIIKHSTIYTIINVDNGEIIKKFEDKYTDPDKGIFLMVDKNFDFRIMDVNNFIKHLDISDKGNTRLTYTPDNKYIILIIIPPVVSRNDKVECNFLDSSTLKLICTLEIPKGANFFVTSQESNYFAIGYYYNTCIFINNFSYLNN